MLFSPGISFANKVTIYIELIVKVTGYVIIFINFVLVYDYYFVSHPAACNKFIYKNTPTCFQVEKVKTQGW